MRHEVGFLRPQSIDTAESNASLWMYLLNLLVCFKSKKQVSYEKPKLVGLVLFVSNQAWSHISWQNIHKKRNGRATQASKGCSDVNYRMSKNELNIKRFPWDETWLQGEAACVLSTRVTWKV